VDLGLDPTPNKQKKRLSRTWTSIQIKKLSVWRSDW